MDPLKNNNASSPQRSQRASSAPSILPTVIGGHTVSQTPPLGDVHPPKEHPAENLPSSSAIVHLDDRALDHTDDFSKLIDRLNALREDCQLEVHYDAKKDTLSYVMLAGSSAPYLPLNIPTTSNTPYLNNISQATQTVNDAVKSHSGIKKVVMALLKWVESVLTWLKESVLEKISRAVIRPLGLTHTVGLVLAMALEVVTAMIDVLKFLQGTTLNIEDQSVINSIDSWRKNNKNVSDQDIQDFRAIAKAIRASKSPILSTAERSAMLLGNLAISITSMVGIFIALGTLTSFLPLTVGISAFLGVTGVALILGGYRVVRSMKEAKELKNLNTAYDLLEATKDWSTITQGPAHRLLVKVASVKSNRKPIEKLTPAEIANTAKNLTETEKTAVLARLNRKLARRDGKKAFEMLKNLSENPQKINEVTSFLQHIAVLESDEKVPTKKRKLKAFGEKIGLLASV